MKTLAGKLLYLLFVSFFLILQNNLLSQENSFIKGVDGSVLDEVEQSGGLYYDDGVETDALEIFKKYGINLVRMKLWHTPDNQYNSLPRVMAMAQRVKALGLKFMLDIHYSDTWADPGHQTKPSAWNGLTFDVLTDSIYAYSKYVVTKLNEQNTTPDFVQIGNEIICGILWNDGKVCNPDTPGQWNKLGILIKSAIQGVQDASRGNIAPKIILHIDRGGDNGGARWFFDSIIAEGVAFDIIGLSYYPWWHGSLTNLDNNLNDLATRYHKDIIVVECAYPWTLGYGDSKTNIVGSSANLLPEYPATVEGQKNFLKDLIVLIQGTNDDRGKGYVYWSPEWIPGHPGSPWENLALFDFDGNALESMSALNTYAGIDENADNKTLRNLTVIPNPFNEAVKINFYLLKRQHLTISITDTFGNQIKNLLNNNILNQGQQSLDFNTASFSPGVYFIIIKGENFSQTVKAVKIEN
jgi:arabinogalactan endo-1,4-beta-galactosidase